MIPILFNQSQAKIGWLSHCISCEVTEERNGVYELSLVYPISGQHAADIAVDGYIKAKPNQTSTNQFFRIYKVSKPISGKFTVSAEHISYALSGYPVKTVTAAGNAQVAIDAILTAAKNQLGKATGFSAATTDITLSSSISLANVSARAALGGVDGSVLDIYGGEYEFDNYTIKLHKSRGADNGVRISYGKNMTDLKCDIDMSASYTGIYGYVKNDTVDLVSVKTVTNSSGISTRFLIKDFSSELNGEEITQADLDNAVKTYLSNNDINAVSVSMSVSFVDLSQSEEYKEVAPLEAVNLCDTVKIYYKDLGVNAKAKVIKTVYNSLKECYNKIELGSARANMSSVIAQATKNAEEAKNAAVGLESKITQDYLAAIDNATAAITGNSGGYIRLNPAQNPQELLIMDTDDINTATNLWRFNLSGWGHSSTGYNGKYTTAATIDGHIVADFIDTGTLTANIIKAGILSSPTGQFSFNLDTGKITASDIDINGGNINIKGHEKKTYYYMLTADTASTYGFKSAADYAKDTEHSPYITADWLTPTTYPTTSPFFIAVGGVATCKMGDSFRLGGEVYNRAFHGSQLDVRIIVAVDCVDAKGNKSTVNLYSDSIPFSSSGGTLVDKTLKVNAATLGSANLTPSTYCVKIGTFERGTKTPKNVTAGWYAVNELIVARTTISDAGGSLKVSANGYTADLSSGVLGLSYTEDSDTQQFFSLANTRLYSSANDYKWYATFVSGNYALAGHSNAGFKFGSSGDDTKELGYVSAAGDANSDLLSDWWSTYAKIEANATTIRKTLVTNPLGYNQFAGLTHYRPVGGLDIYSAAFGVGAPGGKASGAIEVCDKNNKIIARSDVYQNADGEVTLKLQGNNSEHTGYIIVKSDGVYAKYGNNTEKKIS